MAPQETNGDELMNQKELKITDEALLFGIEHLKTNQTVRIPIQVKITPTGNALVSNADEVLVKAHAFDRVEFYEVLANRFKEMCAIREEASAKRIVMEFRDLRDKQEREMNHVLKRENGDSDDNHFFVNVFNRCTNVLMKMDNQAREFTRIVEENGRLRGEISALRSENHELKRDLFNRTHNFS